MKRTVKAGTAFDSRKFNLADDCAIVINGRIDGQLSDLKPNDKLTLSYDEIKGVNVVNRIGVLESPAKGVGLQSVTDYILRSNIWPDYPPGHSGASRIVHGFNPGRAFFILIKVVRFLRRPGQFAHCMAKAGRVQNHPGSCKNGTSKNQRFFKASLLAQALQRRLVRPTGFRCKV